MNEQMIEAIKKAIPICHIHKTKMSPAAWDINSEGETTGTDYVCMECGEDTKPGENTVHLNSGPIIPYYRKGVLAANGERIPYDYGDTWRND